MMKNLESLLSPYPIFGTGTRIDFSHLKPALEKRTIKTGENIGNIEIKLNLNRTLEGIRSYLVMGFPYSLFWTKLEYGAVSAYTAVQDYHKVLTEELTRIKGRLKEFYPEEKFEILVDSGKAFEKELALEAGIGFRGKNSLIINPEYGSFFFIGIILSTALFPDIRSHDISEISCGSCVRCIRTCPPQALDEGFNPVKCIAYHCTFNLEKKELFGYYWGCDLCQIVCPYNLSRNPKGWKRFSHVFLSGLLDPKLSKKEFHKRAANLALNWRGKGNWTKNRKTVFQSRGIFEKPAQKEGPEQ
jgi:epoxyqueuosine reductase